MRHNGNPIIVWIQWGETEAREAQENGLNKETAKKYEFDTIELANAFLTGIDEGDGWNGYASEIEPITKRSALKTALPASINTVAEAKIFLASLYFNGESFHPEDSAHDIIWTHTEPPTSEEAELLDKLMNDIYMLDGNNGDHINPKFDPCAFLMDIDSDSRTAHIKNTLTEAFSECATLDELINRLKSDFEI